MDADRNPPLVATAESVAWRRLGFTAAEWRRLAGFYGAVAALHAAGWGLVLEYAPRHPALVGLAVTAYLFGLRHAFDADHIAAVDDTVRYLLQKGRDTLGIGFFFSLGHSTIVFLLTVAVVLAAALVRQTLPQLRLVGGVLGTGISGTFLWLIGILNLFILLGLLKAGRAARAGGHGHEHVEELLARRGFINRLLGPRVRRMISASWQMYPLGVLFGLGFDTASEIGLLATATGASATLPAPAVLALPVLFAAGMSLLDTTDGVLMSRAYGWAFINPGRKLFYNIAVTALSVGVALVIGTVELLQVLISLFGLKGPAARALNGLDVGSLGYLVVGMFLIAWALSVAIWRRGGFAARTTETPHTHEHSHGGRRHIHRHIH